MTRIHATAIVDPLAEVDEPGDPLDDVSLRSYAIGAAHMAYGWVTSEGIAVDEHGDGHDGERLGCGQRAIGSD